MQDVVLDQSQPVCLDDARRRSDHPTIPQPSKNHLLEAFGETQRAESLGLAGLYGADITAHYSVRGTAERVLRQTANTGTRIVRGSKSNKTTWSGGWWWVGGWDRITK